MNLVIDNAVEVKQITKTNDKESRRSLGTTFSFPLLDITTRDGTDWLTVCRANSSQGRQRVAHPEPVVMGGGDVSRIGRGRERSGIYTLEAVASAGRAPAAGVGKKTGEAPWCVSRLRVSG